MNANKTQRIFNGVDWARLFAFAAAVSIVFSITAKEWLLGAAVAALLISRVRWKLPPVGWPLALFIAGTLVSLLAAGDLRTGFPQVKKFYAFLILPVLATALRGPADTRRLLSLCVGAGVLSSLRSFAQFAQRVKEAQGVDFYTYYVDHRSTGFMSHWMTFGGQAGILLAVALAVLFFARPTRRAWWAAGAAVLSLAVVLNMTRSIWIATAIAVAYLVWMWRPRLVLVLPLVALAAMAIGPVRDRALSIVRPHGEVDSNQHRIVTWRTGIQMIRAHPWLGVGPERAGKLFEQYVPPDIPRPLPVGWYGHLHNNYLHYAAERGLLVLGMLLWFLGKMLADFVRAIRSGTATDVWLVHAGVAVWLSVVIGGFFEVNLGNSEVLHLFLVAMACAYQEPATAS